jgi:hypothetical protein
MASKKTTTKKKAGTTTAAKSKDVVMWLRLPKAMKVEELSKLGLQGAGCYGGDTCIVANTIHPEAGIVVQADLQSSLDKAGLSRRADPCFGGDTCIV